MSIAFFCVLIASVLPILWVGIAKTKNGFDLKANHNPRDFLSTAKGVSKRANAAQQNAWEAFAPFAAAVIIASISNVDNKLIDYAAIVFILMRILHGVFYILDKATLRSLVWTIGMMCNFYLYYLSFTVIR